MTVRAVVLFAHIVGMLVLFVGLAVEWLSLRFLQRANAPAPTSPWVDVLQKSPRYMGAAVGVILVSGIYLAARVGVLDFAWVRVSFGAMVLMGVLGGPVVRSPMRAIRQSSGVNSDRRLASLRRHASHPLLLASLRIRTAVALAIVYLMIGKPDLVESLLLVGLPIVLSAAMTVPSARRVQSEA